MHLFKKSLINDPLYQFASPANFAAQSIETHIDGGVLQRLSCGFVLIFSLQFVNFTNQVWNFGLQMII